VKDVDGATVTALNDEHAVIDVPTSCTLSIGDRVRLIPSHTDPTVNLHDVFYAVEADRVMDVWPIVARGYAEHRR
jgi:D-serine deaminase-like pyridoxal phosphate-dependent protein